ncbi:MAG TPA: phosphatase PAP2 family protein [Dyella sp.]
MNDLVEWIAAHALMLWGGLVLLAVLLGDLASRWNLRQRDAAIAMGREPVAIRARTVAMLLVAMLLLFVAIAIALGAEAQGLWPGFDAALASDLRAQLPDASLRIVAAITHLGDLWTVAAASVVVLAVLLLRRQPVLATCWAIAVAGIVPINSGIKLWFQRPRPLRGYLTEAGWSFPSGHAFGAMVFYGMLAYVLLRLTPLRWHRPVVAGAIAMVTVIGVSRVLLQVHYFSDVLGGYASGLAWLVVCIGGAEYWRLRRAT